MDDERAELNFASYMRARPESTVKVPIVSVTKGEGRERQDHLATEEPLEVRVIFRQNGQTVRRSIAVTMRTPGNDFELAVGFLFTEGIISAGRDIDRISYCTDPQETQHYNIVNVNLKPSVEFREERLSRHVFTSSSCGICGRASIDLVRTTCSRRPIGTFNLTYDFLARLPNLLHQSQRIFSRTGGLHATALVDSDGCLLLVREDVGRHNAMDKIIGALLLQDKIPASDTVALVSGRASFELVQKAILGGIPVVASVGAPSSLAVDLASEYGVTLVGFLRQEGFNVYAGADRLHLK